MSKFEVYRASVFAMLMPNCGICCMFPVAALVYGIVFDAGKGTLASGSTIRF